MPEVDPIAGSLISLTEINEQLSQALVLSSRQMSWDEILIENYRNCAEPGEIQLPALSDHWLNLPLGQAAHLTQKRNDILHESTVQKGDIIFIPAGQLSYWHTKGSVSNDYDYQPMLHVFLKPELMTHVAEKLEFGQGQIDLDNCFSKHDLQLHHIAMLLSAELQTGGLMGQLYRESLTQALAVYLLQHYSTGDRSIRPQHERLTNNHMRQAIDYIHDRLGGDLSLIRIAEAINISPTYFASLFKQKIGVSPHQYVIQQRVEKAIVLLQKIVKTQMHYNNPRFAYQACISRL
jgi:AraC family transcriptional regulator